MSTLKPALPREESELGRNREEKGDKSYYYAHNDKWEVPADAKVRAGPGLVTGGAPVRLGPDGNPIEDSASASPSAGGENVEAQAEVVSELRRRVEELEHQLSKCKSGAKTLSQFSFSDEGAKCKVYLEVGSANLEQRVVAEGGNVMSSEAAIVVRFASKICSVRVWAPAQDGSMDKFAVTLSCESELIPEKCSYKVDRTKGRITLSLVKQDENKKWQSIKPISFQDFL
eukprot:TRINITY_DN37834_c0_g1_i1.p1 TRINITY_DN37834_c0_g1~~TRINITY_DN37834_c0_g1_i1.p1  ORF type:complete len:229 (+),score=38.57 TRINITY_DN37834_c0_g1_i1:166-852(+)